MKPLFPHCFLLLSPLGRQGLVFISLAFCSSPLRFSLERFGIDPQSQIHTLIPAGCLGLSARVWSRLYSTKAFPLPGLKIAFAPLPPLASILQLLKACYFFSPAWYCVWFLEPVPWSHLEHSNHPVLHWVPGTQSRFKNVCVKPILLEGEEDPARALGAFCSSVSWRGKIRLFSWAFLCLVFITAQQKGFQWPGK